VTGDPGLICVVEIPAGTRSRYGYDDALGGILGAVSLLAL
jgi:hypothetical protein